MRVISGSIFDVAVDLRRTSLHYGRWVGEILSSDDKSQLWIPEGFAHGFLALSNNVEVMYKTTNFYNKESELSINPFDRFISINWDKFDLQFIINQKDINGINFSELDKFI